MDIDHVRAATAKLRAISPGGITGDLGAIDRVMDLDRELARKLSARLRSVRSDLKRPQAHEVLDGAVAMVDYLVAKLERQAGTARRLTAALVAEGLIDRVNARLRALDTPPAAEE